MSDASIYRIKPFVKLTGVSAATLRSWEHRYGVPKPARSASGYRLYTDRDVALVRRMLRAMEDGQSAAAAAKSATQTKVPDDGERGPVLDRLLSAVSLEDPIRLEHELRQALFLGGALDVLKRIILPLVDHKSLSSFQARWVRATAAPVVAELCRAVQPDRGRLAIRAGSLHDSDTLGADGLAVRLASMGFRSCSVGTGLTPAELKQSVRAFSPALVVLQIERLDPTAEEQELLLDGYAAACGSVPWTAVGSGARALGSAVTERRGIRSEVDSVFKRRIKRDCG